VLLQKFAEAAAKLIPQWEVIDYAHDDKIEGSSARPYVDGALLAIRKVSTLVGLHRGLDTVLDLAI
jgi:hypothetical protein